MKAFRAILVAGTVLGLSAATVQTPAARPLSLLGQVTDAATGEPVARVHVVIQSERIGAQTSPEGLFALRTDAREEPVELTLRHPCYHTVRLEISSNPHVGARELQIGMPFDHEKYAGSSPPLGGCRSGTERGDP